MVEKLHNTATPTEVIDKTNEFIGAYNEYISTPYLPTAGGAVSGKLTVASGIEANGGFEVTGNFKTTGSGNITGPLSVDNTITGNDIKARGHIITASGIELF